MLLKKIVVQWLDAVYQQWFWVALKTKVAQYFGRQVAAVNRESGVVGKCQFLCRICGHYQLVIVELMRV